MIYRLSYILNKTVCNRLIEAWPVALEMGTPQWKDSRLSLVHRQRDARSETTRGETARESVSSDTGLHLYPMITNGFIYDRRRRLHRNRWFFDQFLKIIWYYLLIVQSFCLIFEPVWPDFLPVISQFQFYFLENK
jgi:hypothetical protein